MSQDTRPKPTPMTVCDLCDEEIQPQPPDSRGSLTYGYIAHRVVPNTRHAWLRWPTPTWLRLADWREKQKQEYREKHYDFHTDCIVRLVESAIDAKEPPC